MISKQGVMAGLPGLQVKLKRPLGLSRIGNSAPWLSRMEGQGPPGCHELEPLAPGLSRIGNKALWLSRNGAHRSGVVTKLLLNLTE